LHAAISFGIRCTRFRGPGKPGTFEMTLLPVREHLGSRLPFHFLGRKDGAGFYLRRIGVV
jgi:hypothetical protein